MERNEIYAFPVKSEFEDIECEQKQICSVCPKEYDNKPEQIFHVVTSHQYINCTFCMDTFELENDKQQHEFYTHFPLRCPICNDDFMCRKLINKHLISEHDSCECEFCFSVISKANYIMHLSSHHNITHALDYLEDGKSYVVLNFINNNNIVCKICDERTTLYLFFSHFTNIHNLDVRFLINTVKLMNIEHFFNYNTEGQVMRFPIVATSQAAMPNNQEAVPQVSSKSKHKNTSPQPLKDVFMQQSCTAREPLASSNKCAVCNQEYSENVPVILHEIYCVGLIKCIQCNKSFKSDNAKNDHTNTEHILNCPLGCQNVTVSPKDINKHCMKVHSITTCKYCGIYVSGNSKRLKDHLKIEHNFKSRKDIGNENLFIYKKNHVKCTLCDGYLTHLMSNIEKVIFHYQTYHSLAIKNIEHMLKKNPCREDAPELNQMVTLKPQFEHVNYMNKSGLDSNDKESHEVGNENNETEDSNQLEAEQMIDPLKTENLTETGDKIDNNDRICDQSERFVVKLKVINSETLMQKPLLNNSSTNPNNNENIANVNVEEDHGVDDETKDDTEKDMDNNKNYSESTFTIRKVGNATIKIPIYDKKKPDSKKKEQSRQQKKFVEEQSDNSDSADSIIEKNSCSVEKTDASLGIPVETKPLGSFTIESADISGHRDINFSEIQCLFSDTSDDEFPDVENDKSTKGSCHNENTETNQPTELIDVNITPPSFDNFGQNKQINCEVCTNDFDTKDSLGKHMVKTHGFKLTACKVDDPDDIELTEETAFADLEPSKVKTENSIENIDNDISVQNVQAAVASTSAYIQLVKKLPLPIYLCRVCNTEVQTNAGARRHFKTHDVLDNVKCDSTELGYKCRFCPNLFWTVEKRNRHQVVRHLTSNEKMQFMKCYVCTTIYSSKTCLKRHIRNVHTDSTGYGHVAYKCLHCVKLFPDLSLTRNHFSRDHPKSVTLYCGQAGCLLKVHSRKNLQQHFKRAHKSTQFKQTTRTGPITCALCNKVLKSTRSVSLHMRMTHNNETRKGFKCRICEERFSTTKDRRAHMTVMHQNIPSFFCKHCSKGFLSKSGLSGHMQTHNTRQHECPYCNKVFSRRDSYMEHILIHNGPRHKCTMCSKEFVQRSNLVRHIRTHTGDKPYSCRFCYKTFADKGACNSHERVHTREEVSNCTYCGQSFSKKQKLKYHMRKHTGEGLKNCNTCDKVFTNGYSLRKHMEIHDRCTQYICECGKGFGSEIYLRRHIENVHNKSRGPFDYNCPICTKGFITKSKLNEHLFTHAEDKHIRCLICDYASSTSKTMRRHLDKKHSVPADLYRNYYHQLNAVEAGVVSVMPVMEDFTDELGENVDIEDDKSAIQAELFMQQLSDSCVTDEPESNVRLKSNRDVNIVKDTSSREIPSSEEGSNRYVQSSKEDITDKKHL